MTKAYKTLLAGLPADKRKQAEEAVSSIVNSKLLSTTQKFLFVNRNKFGSDTARKIDAGTARTRGKLHYVRANITTAGNGSSFPILNTSISEALGVNTIHQGVFKLPTQIEAVGIRLAAEQASTVTAGGAAFSNVAPGTYARPALNGDIVLKRGDKTEFARFNVSSFFAEAAAAVGEPKMLPLLVPQAFAANETLYIDLETGAGSMFSSTNLAFIEVRMQTSEFAD